MLGSFAMWPAFPTSDYYDPSAPFRPHRSATDLPTIRQSTGWVGDRRNGSHVHSEPFSGLGAQLCPCGLATATPQTFTVASLVGDINWPRRSPHAIARVCAATQPISVRLELVVLS